MYCILSFFLPSYFFHVFIFPLKILISSKRVISPFLLSFKLFLFFLCLFLKIFNSGLILLFTIFFHHSPLNFFFYHFLKFLHELIRYLLLFFFPYFIDIVATLSNSLFFPNFFLQHLSHTFENPQL